MSSKVKVIIATICFLLAAVVLAMQFGVFGGSKPKQKTSAAVQADESGTAGSANAPKGTPGASAINNPKPTN